MGGWGHINISKYKNKQIIKILHQLRCPIFSHIVLWTYTPVAQCTLEIIKSYFLHYNNYFFGITCVLIPSFEASSYNCSMQKQYPSELILVSACKALMRLHRSNAMFLFFFKYIHVPVMFMPVPALPGNHFL